MNKPPRIPRWVWVALKQHLDMSKGVDRLIQQQLQPGSIVRLVLNRSLTIIFVWFGSIFGLTVLSWGLTFSNELVKKVRYFIIGIPKIIFWLVAALVKFIKKLF